MCHSLLLLYGTLTIITLYYVVSWVICLSYGIHSYIFLVKQMKTRIFQWLNYFIIYFALFYRHVAIKEIILDPSQKSKTKEAVLKEARYLSVCPCNCQIFFNQARQVFPLKNSHGPGFFKTIISFINLHINVFLRHFWPYNYIDRTHV